MWKFGECLSELLAKKGWKPADLAKHAGLSHVYVGDLLRGQNPKTGRPPKISIDIILDLAKALNVPYTFLVDAYTDRKLTEEQMYKAYLEKLQTKYPDPKIRTQKIQELLEEGRGSHK